MWGQLPCGDCPRENKAIHILLLAGVPTAPPSKSECSIAQTKAAKYRRLRTCKFHLSAIVPTRKGKGTTHGDKLNHLDKSRRL